VVAQIPGIRYVSEPRPGLSVARNTGVRHSKGDIIAFTDDDVTVHPQWIARLQQSFHNSRVMSVTGQVLTAQLETESQVIFEKRNSFNQGYRVLTFDSQFFEQKKHLGVPVWRVGAGANMALRRQIFELVGYFDERLGAGASGCSEDSEFWYRVLASGWICHYEPTAVVYHCHRQNMDSLKQQMYSYMRGHTAALLIQFEKYGHWGNLYRLFIILPKWYARQFLRGFIKGFAPEYKTVFVEFLGCMAGIKFYLQNKRSTVT
jgi:GT2 family glycosyltransferase